MWDPIDLTHCVMLRAVEDPRSYAAEVAYWSTPSQERDFVEPVIAPSDTKLAPFVRVRSASPIESVASSHFHQATRLPCCVTSPAAAVVVVVLVLVVVLVELVVDVLLDVLVVLVDVLVEEVEEVEEVVEEVVEVVDVELVELVVVLVVEVVVVTGVMSQMNCVLMPVGLSNTLSNPWLQCWSCHRRPL